MAMGGTTHEVCIDHVRRLVVKRFRSWERAEPAREWAALALARLWQPVPPASLTTPLGPASNATALTSQIRVMVAANPGLGEDPLVGHAWQAGVSRLGTSDLDCQVRSGGEVVLGQGTATSPTSCGTANGRNPPGTLQCQARRLLDLLG